MKKLTSALFIIFIIFSAKAFAADNEIIKRITEGEESANKIVSLGKLIKCDNTQNIS